MTFPYPPKSDGQLVDTEKLTMDDAPRPPQASAPDGPPRPSWSAPEPADRVDLGAVAPGAAMSHPGAAPVPPLPAPAVGGQPTAVLVDPASPPTLPPTPAGPAPTAAGPAHSARPPRRGPGWGGVIAVGAVAALASSLLTAGLVSTRLESRPTSSGSSAPAAGASSGSSANTTGPVTSAAGTTPNWVAVASAVEPSVVAIQVRTQGGGGEGSGVVFDTQGHIVTNNHVIAEAVDGGSVSVIFSDGRTYPATVTGTDPSTDLAVIALDKPPAGLKPATFGDSAKVVVGQPVMALGNPLGLSDTVTTGIVSAVDRPVSTGGRQDVFGRTGGEPVVTNAIQTDAAVNPGNSGGALVDGTGAVIGITSSIATLGAGASQQAGSIGLGFAIPSRAARAIAQQLIEKGTAQHAYLGVTPTDSTVTLDGATRQAAQLREVQNDTPAAKAGLQAGDAIIAFDGEPVSGSESLVARVRELQPGTSVTLTVVRDGSSRDVSVVLAQRPTTSG